MIFLLLPSALFIALAAVFALATVRVSGTIGGRAGLFTKSERKANEDDVERRILAGDPKFPKEKVVELLHSSYRLDEERQGLASELARMPMLCGIFVFLAACV